MDDLMRDHILYCLTCRFEILARVEMIGMLGKILADVAGHGEADIRVNVDLAHCKLGSFTQLIFGNADSVRHIAAIGIDHLDKLLRNGGRTVQNDRESGQTLDALLQYVETKRRRNQNAVCVARALCGSELIGTVRGTDRDSQRIAAGSADELFYFFRMCIGFLTGLDTDFILNTCERSELSLDDNAVIVSIFNNLTRQRDVVFKGFGGSINHNRSKSAVNAGFAELKRVAVVKMKSNGNFGIQLHGCFNKLYKVSMICIGACTFGYLKNDRAFQLPCRFCDTLNDLHIVDVERTDSISAVIGFCEHFFCGYECHISSPCIKNFQFCENRIFTKSLKYYILFLIYIQVKKNIEIQEILSNFRHGGISMSEKLIGACIFGQSGGPTSVINASAYGVIRTALDAEEITNVYGAAHGIKGVLDDQLYVMEEEDPEELRLLLNTPSSELGSCRYKIADPDVDDTDYKPILEIFKKYNVRYFFYNGGNDSMDTCNKISKYMQKVGYECRVNGVPKTIDNDLFGTDHCPGFASAAKYIATSCMEINKDARVYDTGMVTIVEIMGRHAGWLAASAALATEFGSGPDLIYLPETDFDMEKFLADVEKIYNSCGKVLVAVSEGIHYADGSFVSEAKTSATDGFGHAQLGGLATLLAEVVKNRLKCKVRGVELSLLQRCGAHLASATDINEAFSAGAQAVKAALEGNTDKMVAFERSYDENGKYVCKMKLIPLSDVANFEKKVPLEWINEDQNGVKHEFIDYVLPLIQGEPELPRENSLPRYARLKKVLAK